MKALQSVSAVQLEVVDVHDDWMQELHAVDGLEPVVQRLSAQSVEQVPLQAQADSSDE